MPWRLLGPILAILLSGCAAPAGTGAPSPVALADAGTAQRWGDGSYGVVLVGSGLGVVAERVGADRMTALLPEVPGASTLRAAIDWLHDEGGVERVAIVAAADGTEAAFTVGRESPDLVDQLVTIDAAGAVTGLGPFPKLFIASETDLAVAERLAGEAPGDWNEAAPAADEERLIGLILDRLAERR